MHIWTLHEGLLDLLLWTLSTVLHPFRSNVNHSHSYLRANVILYTGFTSRAIFLRLTLVNGSQRFDAQVYATKRWPAEWQNISRHFKG